MPTTSRADQVEYVESDPYRFSLLVAGEPPSYTSSSHLVEPVGEPEVIGDGRMGDEIGGVWFLV